MKNAGNRTARLVVRLVTTRAAKYLAVALILTAQLGMFTTGVAYVYERRTAEERISQLEASVTAQREINTSLSVRLQQLEAVGTIGRLTALETLAEVNQRLLLGLVIGLIVNLGGVGLVIIKIWAQKMVARPV